MKKAFTLAEALITVAIIGIVAVLLLPHLGNATPDENKIKFLKVYDALSQVVDSLANDESLYASKFEKTEKAADGKEITVTYDTSKYPLINFEKPTDSGYNYTNDTKFCNLLMEGLSGDKNVACSSSVTDLKDFNTKYNFSTQDGAAWLVQPYTGTDRLPTAEKDGNYYATVIVDINGVENGPNAQYSASASSITPDRFTFYVNGNGQVFPADEYSQMYIASRTVWNKNKSQNPADYKAVSTDNNKNFEVPIAIRSNGNNGQKDEPKGDGLELNITICNIFSQRTAIYASKHPSSHEGEYTDMGYVINFKIYNNKTQKIYLDGKARYLDYEVPDKLSDNSSTDSFYIGDIDPVLVTTGTDAYGLSFKCSPDNYDDSYAKSFYGGAFQLDINCYYKKVPVEEIRGLEHYVPNRYSEYYNYKGIPKQQ